MKERIIHFHPLWFDGRESALVDAQISLPLSPDTPAKKKVALSCNVAAPVFASDARQSSYMD